MAPDLIRRYISRIGVGAVLLTGGAAVMSGCDSTSDALPAASLYERVVEGNVFETAPVRGDWNPMLLERGPYTYSCNECHDDFASKLVRKTLVGEHAEIFAAFDHGDQMLCLNCHHATNRNAFVDHDGSEIPSSEPARLCAKCHGPVYRDWTHGVHGRQNGYWDRTRGVRTKLLCTQCHDPHRPAFPLMKPEPPPKYTRFLDVKGGEHE